MHPVEVMPNVFWVGAVDWDVRDFHGYSTPEGSTYNSYLVVDEKIVLFDAVKHGFEGDLLDRISQIVDPAKIDYIIVNHVELDHTGGLPIVMDAVKPEKVLCSAKGKAGLLAHFHRDDWPYEVVSTGSTLGLGKRTVKFIETPMLHWPDSMFSYIEEDGLLISQDAFGQHWATSERFDDEVDQSELMYQSAKYYANILLPYSKLVERLLGEVASSGMKIDMIAPDHGLIWRSDPGKIIDAWGRWSRQETTNKAIVVFDTMWHSTEMMARAIGDALAAEDVSVQVMNLQFSHRADVITELLESKAVIMGSSTLNNGMLPRVADVLCYMKGLRPAPKIAAAFGSFGWGGEAAKLITAALEEMKFTIADPGLKVQYVPTADDLAKCEQLGRNVAGMMRERSTPLDPPFARGEE